jgi:phosphate uptake regulator
MKKNKLKKGDLVYFEENGNGELILNHEVKREKLNREFFIDYLGDIKDLQRKLVTSYISGYNIINIKLKNNTDSDLVLQLLNSLMTFEVIEQTQNKIKAKDLLDIREISIDKIIRRVDNIIRSMMEDVKTSYRSKNHELIAKRDFDVNKLTFLSHRILKKCLENPKLMDSVGVAYERIIDEWVLITNLEKIGDEVKRIARYLSQSNSVKIKEIIEIYDEVYQEYIKCMNSYHKKDPNLAYEVSIKKNLIIDKCNKLLKKNMNPYLFNAIDRIKALEIYVRDNARIVY